MKFFLKKLCFLLLAVFPFIVHSASSPSLSHEWEIVLLGYVLAPFQLLYPGDFISDLVNFLSIL